MHTLTRLLLVCLVALFALGNRGCQTTDTVILPEGPAAAQLNIEKDKQIAGLVAQVKAEQEARELEQALAAKASSNFLGVLKALEYMEPSPAREAASEESKLGKERLGKDDPVETVKALQRVIDIVTGQRDKALNDYAIAKGETAQERARIIAKDAEIAQRDKDIQARNDKIALLEKEKKDEQIKHANDMKDALAKKDKELADYKAERASEERRWWINATRIAGLGLIVVGVILLAVFKLPVEGGGLAAGGVLIGLLSMFFEWLTAQWWFFPLCGIVILGVLIAGGFAIYRLWKKKELHAKMTAALQDLKDESTTLGNNAWETVSDHLKYRLGGKDSSWGKAQAKEVAEMGLVDPKGEAAIKAASSSSTTP